MWGDQQGYVYVPVKEPGTEGKEKWETFFFNWPVDSEEVVQHVLKYSPNFEVYFGPALYIEPTRPIPENILGTNVLWTEFDGNAPRGGILGDKIPHPTMRVRSSNEGHEHLYWRLDYFETDRATIERINRSIAYTLQADSSAWDSTQILRPAGSKNHKRDRIVRLVSTSANRYSADFFDKLPVAKQLAKEELILDDIPDVMSVIFKYPWTSEDALFFRKSEMATGTRSSALMRLAYTCAEMRLSDEEAYSMLRNADDRWGKFKGRRDQDKRLLDLVNRARHKYPIDPEVQVDGLPVFSWKALRELEVHVDWLIPGILQRQGIMVVSGAPGVGKTQLTLQMLIHMAIGKPMLGWEIGPPRKVAFVSMEMGVAEIKIFLEEMESILSPEEVELLDQNFSIVPIGQSLLFDQAADKKKIEQFLDVYKPEVTAFDSLSKTTTSSLEEAAVKGVMDFADQIRMNYDSSVIFIHHNRKGQVGNRKPKQLEDIYGSFYITATATTVIGLWSNNKSFLIEMDYLKVRLAKAPDTTIMSRTPRGLMFEAVTGVDGLVNSEEVTSAGQIESSEQEPPPPGFNNNF